MSIMWLITASHLLTGLLALATAETPADKPIDQRNFSAESEILRAMGLPEGASDANIVQCLKLPAKRVLAVGVIRYRKMSSATPELVKLVTDDKVSAIEKLSAAEALCDFGNKDWIVPMKKALADPNSGIGIGVKMQTGGLFARVGDYSQFEFVASHVGDDKEWVRHIAINTLAKFAHKSDQVTTSAVDVLYHAAISDKTPGLRELSIRSLDAIVKKRPESKPWLIAAAAANADANDVGLRATSQFVLRQNEKASSSGTSDEPTKTEETPK